MSNKPRPEDFPPESPHDLEWGGYNHEKYEAAMRVWESQQQKSEPMSNNKDFQQKPPLGLMPESIWKESRFKDVGDAIQRYLDDGKQIPYEWSIEYSELRQWLEENRQFKSANAVERGWEIVSYKDPSYMSDIEGGDIIQKRNIAILKNYPIHSVRRLSDNLTFCIDEVTPDGRISGFEIDQHGHCMKVLLEGGSRYLWFHTLEKCAPKEEKKPVCYTHNDDLNKYEGDEVWSIWPQTLTLYSTKPSILGKELDNIGRQLLHFSTLEAANEYINLNRKNYSLNDIKYAMCEARFDVWGREDVVKTLLKINKEGGVK